MSWAAVTAAGATVVGSVINAANAPSGGGASAQWARNQQERLNDLYSGGYNDYRGTPAQGRHVVGYRTPTPEELQDPGSGFVPGSGIPIYAEANAAQGMDAY